MIVEHGYGGGGILSIPPPKFFKNETCSKEGNLPNMKN
jgi:hypothetical protein